LPSAAAETRRWTPCPAERLACRQAPVRPRANHGASGKEGPHGPPGSRCSGRADDFAEAPYAQRRRGRHGAVRSGNRYLVEALPHGHRPTGSRPILRMYPMSSGATDERNRSAAHPLAVPGFGLRPAFRSRTRRSRCRGRQPTNPIHDVKNQPLRADRCLGQPGARRRPATGRRYEHNKNKNCESQVRTDSSRKAGPRPGSGIAVVSRSIG